MKIDKSEAPTKEVLQKEILASRQGYKRIYSFTLASNYAKNKNAMRAYKQVVRNFPSGNIWFIVEKSKYQKYHVHGVIVSSCSPFPMYKIMTKSKSNRTKEHGLIEYQTNIRTNHLEEEADLSRWLDYMYKTKPTDIYRYETEYTNNHLFDTELNTCIPLKAVRGFYKQQGKGKFVKDKQGKREFEELKPKGKSLGQILEEMKKQ